MMLVFTKRFRLSALHSLSNSDLSEEENRSLFGSCYQIHGHSYNILVSVTGILDEKTGLLSHRENFVELMNKKVLEPLQGRYLNDFFTDTSGEALVQNIYKKTQEILPSGLDVVKVLLFETQKNRFLVTNPKYDHQRPSTLIS